MGRGESRREPGEPGEPGELRAAGSSWEQLGAARNAQDFGEHGGRERPAEKQPGGHGTSWRERALACVCAAPAEYQGQHARQEAILRREAAAIGQETADGAE